MRDSSIFYRSFYEALKDLPAENQAELYTAIFEYSLNFNEVELTGLSNTIFKLIKPQLMANNKKYENGKKGGAPAKENPDETKDEPKEKQNETKDEPNVNGNDNEKENDNENYNNKPPTAKPKTFKQLSEDEFKHSLVEFVEQFGKRTVRAFFEYWSEKDGKDKMRFQLEKTWDSKRRLTTWKGNEPKFGTVEPEKTKPQKTEVTYSGPFHN